MRRSMPWQLQQPGGLTRFLRHVSDPVDPHYRQYATVESLVARYGAKPKAQKRVLDWVAAHGVEATRPPTHTFVIAKLPARRGAHLLPAAPGATASTGHARGDPRRRGCAAGHHRHLRCSRHHHRRLRRKVA